MAGLEQRGGKGNGDLLVSPVADEASLRKMGIPVGTAANVGSFSAGQARYLEFHRDAVFLSAARLPEL